MKKIYFLVLILTILSSCELTSPQRFESEQLVIAGHLQAGQALTIANPIFIGKTVSTEGGNVFDTVIYDAQVTLENLATGIKDTLIFGFEEDGVGYYNDDVFIHSGMSYRLEVEAQVDSALVSAWAQTTVPDSMVLDLDYNDLATAEYGFAEEFSDNLPQIPYDKVETDFPVYSRFTSGDIVYSYYNYYCLEEFSTSLEFTDPIFGYEHLEEDDEESYNSPLSNNMRSISSLWRYQPLEDDEGNWYLLEETYDGGFQYYGRYRLTIYSLDENYFRYVYHSESYGYGGINGGIGYFGSVYGEDFFTEIIK